VNTPPAAGAFALGVAKNTPGSFSASKVLKDATDSDSDVVSLTAVSSASARGGTVSLSDSTLTYTPAVDYTGPDTFTYTLSDSFITSTGMASVTVGGCSSRIDNLVPQVDGNKKLLASGLPGQSYSIQACTVLGNWTEIGTALAATNGLVSFVDGQATNFTSRNYRLAAP